MGEKEDLQIDALQNLIPTCQRCHRQRRKCDTQLPACRLCQKAKVECMIYDHAMQEARPRAYVQALLTRLEQLKAAKARTLNDSSTLELEPEPEQETPRTSDPSSEQMNSLPAANNRERSSNEFLASFDINLMLSWRPGQTTRYFGASSVFSLSVHLLNCAYAQGFITNELTPESAGASPLLNIDTDYPASNLIKSLERLNFLIEVFFASINTLYGFIDRSTTNTDLQAYMQLTHDGSFVPQNLDSCQAHQYFRTNMICAIVCANRARHDPVEQAKSMAFFTAAVTCVEDVTSEVSPESLQALLLLIVFCLFYPNKGDLWKLLDYACRLSIELGYHTELDIDNESEDQKNLRRSTFWGLYAIERIVGQLLGRGSDLPEAIITAHYPNSWPSQSFDEFETVQAITIAHHYRLVYIRSEIYRDLYLSTDMPVFPIEWYREQFSGLLAWRHELHVENEMIGVSTVTCDVGYYSTICFLFQPVMLSALTRIKDSSNQQQPCEELWIPQDNFHAACELICVYEKVVRAPQNSALGVYPMTFFSAHYIYLAGLTLMTHCLLALDKRIPVMPPFSDMQHENNHEGIDFSAISEISASCLILLTWCSDRWPAMVSMLNIYKRLSDRLIPALIRSRVSAV